MTRDIQQLRALKALLSAMLSSLSTKFFCGDTLRSRQCGLIDDHD
ncbi:hypothetical protein [Thalassotalea algicola]|nr:hypothetical protein [Thalassotalea algicola]